MILTNTLYLEKIQKILALFTVIFSTIALLLNFLNFREDTEQWLINTGTILLVMTLSCIIFLINNGATRALQILIFFIVGVFAILLDRKTRFIGNSLYTCSILMAYVYGLIKNVSYKTLGPIAGGMILLRLISGLLIQPPLDPIDCMAALFSLLILFFVLVLFKIEIKKYIKESSKNETMRKLAANVGALTHNFNMATGIRMARKTHSFMKSGKPKRAEEFLSDLIGWLSVKEELKNSFMTIVNQSRINEIKRFDLHKTLKGLMELYKLDRKIFCRMKITMDLHPVPIIIKAVPYEIYFLFQNLIQNAIDAMTGGGPHRLSIKTVKQGSHCTITITDTGKGLDFSGIKKTGFPKAPKTSKGFGLLYVDALIKQYGGTLKFLPGKERGTEVRVTLKLH